jgi:hypothetical protein
MMQYSDFAVVGGMDAMMSVTFMRTEPTVIRTNENPNGFTVSANDVEVATIVLPKHVALGLADAILKTAKEGSPQSDMPIDAK